jgi:Tfp pilus assembly protein PilF
MRLKPGQPQTYHARATIYARMGNVRQALADMRSALAIDPDDEEYRQYAAMLCIDDRPLMSQRGTAPLSVRRWSRW